VFFAQDTLSVTWLVKERRVAFTHAWRQLV